MPRAVWIIAYFFVFPFIVIMALSYARGFFYEVICDDNVRMRERKIHALMGLSRIPFLLIALTTYATLDGKWQHVAIGWTLAVAIFSVDDNRYHQTPRGHLVEFNGLTLEQAHKIKDAAADILGEKHN